MDSTRAREVARRTVPKVAAVALAIGSDTLAATAGLALVTWNLAKRLRAAEARLDDLAARVDHLEGRP
jgi:cell division protein FtsB